jgi:universal stress protein A
MSDPTPPVLLATDFSDACAPAAELAAAYARRLGARLHVLHVTHAGWEGEQVEVLRAYVRRFADVALTATVETGSPADRIVAYADRNRVQLIVLGTHGRAGRTRAFLGSVAERVTRAAHCPVMTVPADLHAEPLRPPPSPDAGGLTVAEPAPSRRCLVCHSVSEASICDPCAARIRGEALERKRRDENARV